MLLCNVVEWGTLCLVVLFQQLGIESILLIKDPRKAREVMFHHPPAKARMVSYCPQLLLSNRHTTHTLEIMFSWQQINQLFAKSEYTSVITQIVPLECTH